ncbi:hypothetical protein BHECKSOX_2296 [Bathymodiolus heckerae thiotrophic gill symbiont]|uniref:autoinducer binding domain-containing protein n=1 Tax=Bathymodiolus heckerae thiotrophic gill symbiont TaxID=1052212 RepID=UPI0010B972D1|nr:autoinducer binding domain-containing protein [Bathymodiolus heckerae thiotrophic gill symbiont]SHN93199.1 hypothetical protein BHECKSOX_2296 [Bathymodiolus heckerae thiotrophic gill symbiont]
MKNWQISMINKIQAVKCEQSLLKTISLLSKDLGFDYCAYGIRSPLPLSNPKTITINNYCVAWQEKYKINGYLEIDPTVQHALYSSQPIRWTDQLFSSACNLMEDARSFGLHHGIAFPIHDPSGFTGMLTLSRSHELINEAEFYEKILKLSWLTQVIHIEMTKYLVPKLIPEAKIKLSKRETEVLQWTADGKTSWEISYILNIAERTVNFHINNCVAKLKVCNKTSATIKALTLGLLQ